MSTEQFEKLLEKMKEQTKLLSLIREELSEVEIPDNKKEFSELIKQLTRTNELTGESNAHLYQIVDKI